MEDRFAGNSGRWSARYSRADREYFGESSLSFVLVRMLFVGESTNGTPIVTEPVRAPSLLVLLIFLRGTFFNDSLRRRQSRATGTRKGEALT